MKFKPSRKVIKSFLMRGGLYRYVDRDPVFDQLSELLEDVYAAHRDRDLQTICEIFGKSAPAWIPEVTYRMFREWFRRFPKFQFPWLDKTDEVWDWLETAFQGEYSNG